MMTPLATITAESSVFTLGGLPLHPLVVHAVVVMLPLSVVGLFAVVLSSRLRRRFGALVMVGLAIGTGAAVVAVKAGEQLAVVTGISDDHREWGEALGQVSVLLLLLSLAWFALDRKPLPALPRITQPLLAGGALAAGLAALLLTLVVGHSGASAVWENRLAPAPQASPSVSADPAGYTSEQVAQHGSTSDCWTSIDGQVYDVTEWITRHPGGSGVISALCGTDGSPAFEAEHGGQDEPQRLLEEYRVGPLRG